MYPIHPGTLLVSEYYHIIQYCHRSFQGSSSCPWSHVRERKGAEPPLFTSPILYLSIISRLLITSVISFGNPNNIRSQNHITHITLYRQRTLSVRTLRVRELCRHDRDTSPSITNSGTWMLILVPTYSTKIFIGRTVMTTYVIPFVHLYVTCLRFGRRYLHT